MNDILRLRFNRLGIIVYILLSLFWSVAYSGNRTIFPLEHYDQKIAEWIDPHSFDYNTPLLSVSQQQARLHEFYNHYFSLTTDDGSPWNEQTMASLLLARGSGSLISVEQQVLASYDNRAKLPNQLIYGENFRPYNPAWIDGLSQNMNISRLNVASYNVNNRAIAVTNLEGRQLPTNEVAFYNYEIAGEGYPFDNLQQSAIWAGTPLYIILQSIDHAWDLVATPDFIVWVPSSGVARVNDRFINVWSNTAHTSLVAVTQAVPIVDTEGIFYFKAYIGSVFPAIVGHGAGAPAEYTILIPVINTNGFATIKMVKIGGNYVALMPLVLSPHNLAIVMSQLIGRSYGWGNMYFYNDCSAELKALYTPFAIYLPRNSGDQAEAGLVVDLSNASTLAREQFLMRNGHKFLTLVHIPGHILMYMGNYTNLLSPTHEQIAVSYQDIWGLRPADSSYRSVIGQSVILPLLHVYPEDTNLVSLYDKKLRPLFEVIYLDQAPSPGASKKSNLLKIEAVP